MSVTRDNNPLYGIPRVESPFFKSLFNTAIQKKDKELYDVAIQLNEKGYAILKFPDKNFNKQAEKIKEDLLPLYDWKTYRENNTQSLCITDAWKIQEGVKNIACNPRVIQLLLNLYGREPVPFQTLNYSINATYSLHNNSIEYSSIPERFFCSVYVALEDIDDDLGVLECYPGSHKWPIYTNEHIAYSIDVNETTPKDIYQKTWKSLIHTTNTQPETVKLKKGDMLILCANLLYSDSLHSDVNKTKWSQVTHYYFENCCYYTAMSSEVLKGLISYKEITDITTGNIVKNKCNNVLVSPDFISKSKVGHSNQPIPQNEFNAAQYLIDNPDVKDTDAYSHYIKYGFYEKRKACSILDTPLIPENDFNIEQYITDNPDVKIENAYKHYLTHGVIEKRKAFSLSGKVGPLPKNKFDAKAYLIANKDVKDAGVDAYEHYLNSGYHEKRPLSL